MQAGRRNHLVTLQSPAGTQDAVGERATTWTDVSTAWARIAPLSVSELLLAGQMLGEVTVRVVVPYFAAIAAIDNSWRVSYGSRVFTIGGVRNVDEANVEFELLCSEGVRVE